MKKILNLCFFVFLCTSLNAQNNTGIGTTTPNSNALLELDNNSNPLGLLLPRQDISTFAGLGASENGLMVFNTVDNKVYTWNGSVWVSGTSEWGVNGTDIFNLNTGNVGIGTSNPQTKLQIEGTGSFFLRLRSTESNSSAYSELEFGRDNGVGGFFKTGGVGTPGSGDYLQIFSPQSIRFNSNFATRMVIDNSGNVGIGTQIPTKILSVVDATASSMVNFSSSGSNTIMEFNNSGINPADWSFGYLGNTGGNPGFMTFLNGSHRFVVTNNGDVGIDDTNPQARLEINSSGNSNLSQALVINNSSATNLFSVRDDGRVGIGVIAPAGVIEAANAEWNTNPIVLNTTGTVGPSIRFQNTAVGNHTYDIIGSTGTGASTGAGFFGIYDNTSFAYRFVISPTGQIGIGTNIPTASFHVAGTGLYTGRLQLTATTDASGTAGTGVIEIANALRIDGNEIITNTNTTLFLQNDNGGDLSIGNGRVYVDASTNRVGVGTSTPATQFHLNHTSGFTNGLSISNSVDADRWHFYCYTTNTLRLHFNGVERGTFNSTTGAYTSVSDRRFKNDIQPMPSVLDKVAQLQPVEYKFNWQEDSNQIHTGFIAQDVEPLFPSLVMQTTSDHPSENSGEINDSYSLDYAGFSVIAIKAIQELKVENEKLKARIEALELK